MGLVMILEAPVKKPGFFVCQLESITYCQILSESISSKVASFKIIRIMTKGSIGAQADSLVETK